MHPRSPACRIVPLQRRPYTAGLRVSRRDPAAPARARPPRSREARRRARPRRSTRRSSSCSSSPPPTASRGRSSPRRSTAPTRARTSPTRRTSRRTTTRPAARPATGSDSTEVGDPLLRLNLAADPAAPRGQADVQRGRTASSAQLDKQPAAARKNGTGPNAAANYPPLYYAYEAVAYELSPARVAARAAVLHAPGHDAAARRHGVADVADRRPSSSRARGCARWPPGWSRCSPSSASAAGIINPDLMLVMVATGALLMGLRLVRHGPTIGPRAVAGRVRRRRSARPSARALPARRSPSSRSSSRSCAPGRAGAGALGFSAARGRDHVRLRGDRRRLVAGARGRRDLREPGRAASARASSLSYLWQFYLPKLSVMDPKVGPRELRLPPGLHRLLLQRLRLVQRQLPADRPRRSCRSLAGHRARRAVDHDRRALARRGRPLARGRRVRRLLRRA